MALVKYTHYMLYIGICKYVHIVGILMPNPAEVSAEEREVKNMEQSWHISTVTIPLKQALGGVQVIVIACIKYRVIFIGL